MTTPKESSNLLTLYQSGRLSRAHIERFATELAICHSVPPGARGAETALGYSGKVGLILRNVLLHHGQLILRPPPAIDASNGSHMGALSDVASVMLELELLRQSSLSNFFLAAWLEQTGVFDVLRLLPAYIAREALLFVDEQSAPGGGDDRAADVRRALLFAGERVRPRRPRSLLITHGLSGAGKTTLATALAGLVGAVVVRSDAELMRGKLHSAALADDSALGTHLDRIEMLAVQAIDAGWPVIVEGCFLSRVNRRRFRAKAAELGVPFAILDCSAPLEAIRVRLDRRRAFGSLFHGDDASAHRVREKLYAQMGNRDPLDHDESASAIRVDTGEQVDHQHLALRILELGA